MTSGAAAERWRRARELFAAALEREPAERSAWLDAACAGDPSLRDEVASLLRAHERTGAVDRIAGDLAPLAAGVRASAARASLAGRTVGHYEVHERVGGGGMGVVHRAFDTRLGRTVALKFLQPRIAADDSAAERFRLEARTVAALEHPNVCTVHEIGETDDGRLYLAMPLYEGETLQQRIARGPLPVGEAVAVAVQVARGLARAHARGIVHRDVKPSNVFLTADGPVKLLDFGIAKLADVTLTGSAGGNAGPLGTAAYMSPEQARGDRVDHRTDIWSLGVVLYEMLAGRRAFAGDSTALVLESIQHARPVPLVERGVPLALARVVETALARDPAARWDSATAMERALLALGLGAEVPGGPASGDASARRRLPSSARRRRVVVGAGVLAALAVLAVLAGAAHLARRFAPANATSAAAPVASTIAVLPFVDRSPARDQEYFADGISEELIATLSRVEGLHVAARTSAFAFKGREEDVRVVGARLGVATVLEGSLRRAGDSLRITAQLVRAGDGYILWSGTYDRAAGDAFAVQQEIARGIAQVLRMRLVSTVDAAARAPDPQAFDLYLKGRHALYLRQRYAWYTRTESGLRSAARFFEQAAAQDPGYARAHAGAGDAWAVLGFYDFEPPTIAFPKAAAAARRALAVDPTLGAAHATLGYVALYHDWDLARSESEFRRAIALDPAYATGHQWHGNLLVATGRFDEAARAMRRAQEIDPLNLVASAALGWVHYHAGDHAEAVAQSRRTLELNSEFALALLWGGWALQAMDSLPAAVTMHRRAVAHADSADVFVAALARTLALAGQRPEAEALLRRMQARADSGRYVPSYEIARVHEALGDQGAALRWLERAHTERAHSMVFLRVDPQLARLRGDPRFARLVRRVFGS